MVMATYVVVFGFGDGGARRARRARVAETAWLHAVPSYSDGESRSTAKRSTVIHHQHLRRARRQTVLCLAVDLNSPPEYDGTACSQADSATLARRARRAPPSPKRNTTTYVAITIHRTKMFNIAFTRLHEPHNIYL